MRQQGVGLASDVPLETTNDLHLAQPLGCAPDNVRSGAGVETHASEDNEEKSAVGLAVAASAEAMAHGLPRARWHGRNATQVSERRLATETLGIVPGRNKECGCRFVANAFRCNQGWGGNVDEGADVSIEARDLTVKLEVPTSNRTHGKPGGAILVAGRTCPPPRCNPEELARREAGKAFLETVGRCDYEGVELVGGLSARFHSTAAGHPQNTEPLDEPITSLGHDSDFPREDCSRGSLGVERIRLAGYPAAAAVRTFDLQDLDALTPQKAADAQPIAAAAFDSSAPQLAQS
jgi:hypothetical protein